MKSRKRPAYFSRFELLLYCGSVLLILLGFFLFDRKGLLMLAASLIGVTSLLFAAKGHPVAQALMILFSLLYGYISYTFAYWGEMITYLGMTLPMAIFSLIAWLRHPFRENHSQVAVHQMTGKELAAGLLLSIAVTVLFYFLLKALRTPNLAPSTLSVFTSFAAVYFTLRRSPYYALAYAANDLVLIVLWVLAMRIHREYCSVALCFLVFLINDLYGFYNWKKMHRMQTAS